MKKSLLFLVLCLGVAANAVGYTRIVASNTGAGAHWASMPINYFINQQGSSQIFNDSETLAVHAAFQTWADVQSANIRFNYRGTSGITTGGSDTVNLVSFADNTYPWDSGTLAVTLNFFSSQTGITNEADILFNPNRSWTTSGETGKFDIQGIMTHEIGHLLGLDHSGIISSVMSPFSVPTQVDQRILQYDDISGVTEIYPASSNGVGRISGTVMSGTQPVKGAHVVAVDSNGTPLVSTISATNGSYTIRNLPPGGYRVYAEPLDGPVAESALGGFYSALNTDFGTTYYPSEPTLSSSLTVQVAANAATTAAIVVLPRPSGGLNITRPIFAPRLGLGVSGELLVQGFDLASGVVFSASNAAVLLGAPTFATSPGSSTAPTNARIPLTVSPGAAFGPKNIAVHRGTDGATASGVIVVVNAQPFGVAVSPASGSAAGGERVNVTGSNFRSGAKVYFGGIPSSDVRFISPSFLDVLTPPNLPGSALVLVVNADGTNGVSVSGYVYENAPPTISGLSPSSGPPTTTVTIGGTNFDPFGAQVIFNGGVSGRVISASATSIVTAVPYGATTGAVTVTSYGHAVTGPVFVVTPPPASTNLASTRYDFTDASASAGGTSLNFTSNDDGTSSSVLPFTFSLFRDIYPAGSQITVTTNGFISLETGSSPAFQNGQLPAASAQQPAAVGCFTISADTRAMPRSLIAPFFDDLVLIPAVSSVSTRVVGTAPNRRFIVQWSRLSVLDESGCDLNSRISFQAVLFEGSNDIQFLYEALTGPRSNGVSATVGLQDQARTTGVQTSFNEARLRTGSYITYRYDSYTGMYSVFAADATAPSTPVVLDGGAATNSTSSLSASWSSDDPQSGIREYQYAIGTSAGASNIVPFTTTTTNFVVVNGLTLTAGSTYYFSVRAVNNDGLVSDVGVSDGITINTALTFTSRAIPFVQDNASRYTGIALLAPSAMSVTLNAVNTAGTLVATTSVSLSPGQQYARMLTDIFNVPSFEGWVEVLPSAPGLGVLAATGTRDSSELDAIVPRDLSSDFIALHAGATLWMANPSGLAATVTVTTVGSSSSTTLTIPARGRASVTLQSGSRVTSTQPLAAIELLEDPGRLAMFWVESPNGASSLTFPHAAIGAVYSTAATLVNLGRTTTATVQFNGASREVQLLGNATTVLSLNALFQIPANLQFDAVRVTTVPNPFAGAILIGSVDIATPTNLVFVGSRAMSTEFIVPHVAQDATLFTGIAFVTGSVGTQITIDVYSPDGSMRRTGSLFLPPNTQSAKVLSELVPSLGVRHGGYIRIRTDQPILAWGAFGSQEAFSAAPPL